MFVVQEETLDEVDARIDDIAAALEPFLKHPLKTLSRDVSGTERAKLHASHAYAVYSLLYSE